MSESSAWKIREVFDALGYTLDSDTDDMIGERCRGEVVIEIQAQGARAGQQVNTLRKVLPVSGVALGESNGVAAGVGAQSAASDDPWS